MVPHVAFERGDVEVADDQRRPVDRIGPAGHPVEEIEFLAELCVLLAVGFVAARRDIDVLDDHPLVVGQLDPDMARFAIVLPVVAAEFPERRFRYRRDAVIALLPMHGKMLVSQRAERLVGKLVLLALDLLQAQHIGRLLFDEALDDGHAQADGIDVPGSDRNHAGALGRLPRRSKHAPARPEAALPAHRIQKTPVPGALARGFPVSVRHA